MKKETLKKIEKEFNKIDKDTQQEIVKLSIIGLCFSLIIYTIKNYDV